jgi:outer membrane lipoprotein-sorting protein
MVRHFKTWVVLATLGIFGLLVSPLTAQNPTALQIIQNADEIRGAQNWGFNADIVDYQQEGGAAKVLSQNSYRVTARTFGEQPDQVYKSVAFFLEPANVRGQKSLKDGNIYWQYFPETKNMVRISGAQRLAGQVSAADLASSNFANDYNPTLVGEEDVLGKKCYKLELMQKNEDVAYYKLEYWVEQGTFNPTKVMYYAVSGQLLKTSYYRDFKMALGRNKPHELFIVDPLNAGHITRLLYSKLREESVPEYFFGKDNLGSVNAPADSAEETPSPMDIIAGADDKRCADDWKFSNTVYEFKPDDKGNAKLASTDKYTVRCKLFDKGPNGEVTESTVSKSFVEFIEPASTRGQKLLREGRVYWLFFPETKNTVRISPSQVLSGQATAGDIAATNYRNDYDGKILSMETILDKECYKLELTAKDEGVAYHKLLYWVEKGTNNPIKTEYYSVSGTLLKTGYYRNFEKVEGSDSVKARELFIVNPLVKNHVTRMIFSEIAPEKSPEYMFSKSNLK